MSGIVPRSPVNGYPHSLMKEDGSWYETRGCFHGSHERLGRDYFVRNFSEYYIANGTTVPWYNKKDVEDAFKCHLDFGRDSTFDAVKFGDLFNKFFPLSEGYDWRPARSGERIYDRPEGGYVGIPVEYFRAGLRLDTHRFLWCMFKQVFDCALGQVSPNGVRMIVWYCAACLDMDLQPTFKGFFAIFDIFRAQRAGVVDLRFRGSALKIEGFHPLALGKNISGWADEFVFVKGGDLQWLPPFRVCGATYYDMDFRKELSETDRTSLESLCRTFKAPWETKHLHRNMFLHVHGVMSWKVSYPTLEGSEKMLAFEFLEKPCPAKVKRKGIGNWSADAPMKRKRGNDIPKVDMAEIKKHLDVDGMFIPGNIREDIAGVGEEEEEEEPLTRRSRRERAPGAVSSGSDFLQDIIFTTAAIKGETSSKFVEGFATEGTDYAGSVGEEEPLRHRSRIERATGAASSDSDSLRDRIFTAAAMKGDTLTKLGESSNPGGEDDADIFSDKEIIKIFSDVVLGVVEENFAAEMDVVSSKLCIIGGGANTMPSATVVVPKAEVVAVDDVTGHHAEHSSAIHQPVSLPGKAIVHDGIGSVGEEEEEEEPLRHRSRIKRATGAVPSGSDFLQDINFTTAAMKGETSSKFVEGFATEGNSAMGMDAVSPEMGLVGSGTNVMPGVSEVVEVDDIAALDAKHSSAVGLPVSIPGKAVVHEGIGASSSVAITDRVFSDEVFHDAAKDFVHGAEKFEAQRLQIAQRMSELEAENSKLARQCQSIVEYSRNVTENHTTETAVAYWRDLFNERSEEVQRLRAELVEQEIAKSEIGKLRQEVEERDGEIARLNRELDITDFEESATAEYDTAETAEVLKLKDELLAANAKCENFAAFAMSLDLENMRLKNEAGKEVSKAAVIEEFKSSIEFTKLIRNTVEVTRVFLKDNLSRPFREFKQFCEENYDRIVNKDRNSL